MFGAVKNRWPIIILIVYFISMLPGWAFAQAGIRLRVTEPDTTQFPNISFLLSVTDETGTHLSRLSAPNFTIIEDGETIGIDLLNEVMVGTRQVFIINSARGLRGRDAQGLTRYDYIRKSLVEWWGRVDAAAYGIDDLSLVSLDGELVTHTSLAAELASSLASYEPSFAEEFASFDLLLQALQLSDDTLIEEGMPTLVFFITPLIPATQELPLANTITRAKETGTIIYPILVGPSEILEFPEVDNLELLAQATGGELILFDAEEGLDELAERILTRRMLYELRYTSKVSSTGSHNLQVRVTTDGFDGVSEPSSFNLNISAPEVILMQMPDQIRRETDNPDLALGDIPPTSMQIEYLVTFPDGYPREIVASQLVIDNQVVEIQTQPPFASIEWDLRDYQESGSHEIKIIVEDSLGLQGSATGLPIRLEVKTPERTLTTFRPDLEFLIPVGGGFAGLLIIVALAIAISRRRREQSSETSRDQRRRPATGRTRGFRRKSDQAMIEASLVPVTPNLPLITLIGMDLVLGRDASISAAQLDDPSVDALHARVIRLASGDYLLRDQGSVAGSWVNYQQVPERGRILQHGDVIHLGRVEYQFQLRNPPLESRIHVESVSSNPSKPEIDQRGNEETTA